MAPSFDNHFPFKQILSLRPLVDFWREITKCEDHPHALLAREILARVDEAKFLSKPIKDTAMLKEHKKLVYSLMSAAIPLSKWTEVYAGAYRPYDVHGCFFATPAYEHLGLNNQETFLKGLNLNAIGVDEEMIENGRTMNAYHRILNAHYGTKVELNYPTIFTGTDPDTGLIHHFKVSFDTQFVNIKARKGAPKLTKEEIKSLVADPMNLQLWLDTLPPEYFVFEGIILILLVDVTEQEVVSLLKHDLLQKESMTTGLKIDDLQKRIRTLLRLHDMRLGLIALERGELDTVTGARVIGRSLLMHDETIPHCQYKHKSSYMEVLKTQEPVVIHDLTGDAVRSGLEYKLKEQGFRNLLLIPLLYEDKVIGLLELASPNVGDLNAFSVIRLMEVVPLFATAMNRSLDEREDRVQAVIKEQYTAIHPAVEWRFQKAAQNYMERWQSGQPAKVEPIVFPDVYPLYGLSDIRNSSVLRNQSIQTDLVSQLQLGLAVIVEAATYQPLPVLDELGFRIANYITDIQSGLSSGDETDVLSFLQRDLESLFDRIRTFGPGVPDKIEAYQAALDSELGILYQERKDYEDSVMVLNDTIGAFIDEQEEQAQAMFPHYFEKYKTDGVDYNLYVGASLMEDGKFDMLYLHNLRLWQLMMMAGLVWELDRLRPSLKVKLDAAHLILVHSNPLSIRFRLEEKKFDVDGAYNIRYEIIKKRIDKARIKETGERLTQPGKIAIVYAQDKDAYEYRRYFDYLHAAGYLNAEVEDVHLEDLQGVTGLRALRVTVSSEMPGAQPTPDPEHVAAISGDGALQLNTAQPDLQVAPPAE